MIDPKIADAAFGLKKDELSKPVEGQFAIVLVRVGEIVPGKQRTYEEVKGEIKDRMAEERVNREMQALHDKAENERSAGKTAAGDRRGAEASLPRDRPDRPQRQDRRRQAGDRACRGGKDRAGGVLRVGRHRGRRHRARRRRLCLDRRAGRHAREAEALRGGPGRGEGRGHRAGAAQGDRRVRRQAGGAPERRGGFRGARQGDRRQAREDRAR